MVGFSSKLNVNHYVDNNPFYYEKHDHFFSGLLFVVSLCLS